MNNCGILLNKEIITKPKLVFALIRLYVIFENCIIEFSKSRKFWNLPTFIFLAKVHQKYHIDVKPKLMLNLLPLGNHGAIDFT